MLGTNQHQSNGFRMAIVVNGNEQRIINGNVYIPFNSEYSVRIVNTNGVRGKIKLSIDGMDEDEYFVVDANNSITISRFMCGNLNSGNSFQFVSKSDSRVNNPNNGSNGLVRIQCWKEKIQTITYKIKKNKTINPYEPYTWQPDENWNGYGITWTAANDNFIGRHCEYKTSLNFFSQAGPKIMYSSNQVSQEGATVGGNEINQQFHEVDDFMTETQTTYLSIKLMGKN